MSCTLRETLSFSSRCFRSCMKHDISIDPSRFPYTFSLCRHHDVMGRHAKTAVQLAWPNYPVQLVCHMQIEMGLQTEGALHHGLLFWTCSVCSHRDQQLVQETVVVVAAAVVLPPMAGPFHHQRNAALSLPNVICFCRQLGHHNLRRMCMHHNLRWWWCSLLGKTPLKQGPMNLYLPTVPL